MTGTPHLTASDETDQAHVPLPGDALHVGAAKAARPLTSSPRRKRRPAISADQRALRRELGQLTSRSQYVRGDPRFERVDALVAAALHHYRYGTGRTFMHCGLRFRWCTSNIGRLIVQDADGASVISTWLN